MFMGEKAGGIPGGTLGAVGALERPSAAEKREPEEVEY
jgi:hypothetical protein